MSARRSGEHWSARSPANSTRFKAIEIRDLHRLILTPAQHCPAAFTKQVEHTNEPATVLPDLHSAHEHISTCEPQDRPYPGEEIVPRTCRSASVKPPRALDTAKSCGAMALARSSTRLTTLNVCCTAHPPQNNKSTYIEQNEYMDCLQRINCTYLRNVQIIELKSRHKALHHL